jgi:transcriptional regulator with XRE-family HTH domain
MNRQKSEIDGICKSLRQIRQAKSLSLSDVETLSKGALKAVVLGSYERGTRSLSVRRALQIAELYEVPLSVLLTGQSTTSRSGLERVMIDLRRVRSTKEDGLNQTELTNLESLRRYLRGVTLMRNDWNGEVISLRSSDIEVLSLLGDGEYEEYFSWLSSAQLLLRQR